MTNSVVKDENSLITNILQELRLNQKDGHISFPDCLMGLTARFPGCVIQSSFAFNPQIPYEDKEFVLHGINSSDLQSIVPPQDKLVAVAPAQFDKKGMLGHNDGVKLENGNIHWGTTLGGLPHGFGRMKFAPKFSKNTAAKSKYYVFYEGMFEYGKLNGKGCLLLEDNRLMVGQFVEDQFHGEGKQFALYDPKDPTKENYYIGEFRNGSLTGKGLKLYYTGLLLQGNFLQNEMFGPGICIYNENKSEFALQKNNKKEGLGVYNSSSGKYCGQFKKDLKCGFGQLITPKGYTYRGMFLDNVYNGYGMEVSTSGNIHNGFFLNN